MKAMSEGRTQANESRRNRDEQKNTIFSTVIRSGVKHCGVLTQFPRKKLDPAIKGYLGGPLTEYSPAFISSAKAETILL